MLNLILGAARGAGAIYKTVNYSLGAAFIVHSAWKWYRNNKVRKETR